MPPVANGASERQKSVTCLCQHRKIGEATGAVFEVSQQTPRQRLPGTVFGAEHGIEDNGQQVLAMRRQHFLIYLEESLCRFIAGDHMPETVQAMRWKGGVLHQKRR